MTLKLKIETCDFNGTNRRVIYESGGLSLPKGLDVFDNKLYFADAAHESIMIGELPSMFHKVVEFKTFKENIDDIVTVKVHYKRASKLFMHCTNLLPATNTYNSGEFQPLWNIRASGTMVTASTYAYHLRMVYALACAPLDFGWRTVEKNVWVKIHSCFSPLINK